MPKKAGDENAIVSAAKAIGKAAGKVAGLAAGESQPETGEQQPPAPPAPRSTAKVVKGKLPKKNKERLPRRLKKVQRKAAPVL
jgi:hypothetical protein